MAIKLLNYYLFSVPVDFEISKIHIPYSRHIIIEVLNNGKRGVGEGVSYRSSLGQIEKLLLTVIPAKAGIQNTIYHEPGLVAAFDQAVLDAKNKIPHDLYHDYTRQVFIEKPEQMFLKIEKLIKNHCRQIKLKLGRNLKNDIYLINKLKQRFPKTEFKADVNGGYKLYEFEGVIKQTGNFIKTWGEPVAKKNLVYLKELKKEYKIKIMLDENVKTLAELEFYIKKQVIDVLNIKLSRVGGITEAKKYIEICQKNAVLISVGCSEELGVGMWGTNYLASQIRNLYGIEGEGRERLGFDIINNKNDYSFKELQKSSRKFNFKIFTHKNKMSVRDKMDEYRESVNAKFRNLLVRLWH